jgi:hypothetical protein
VRYLPVEVVVPESIDTAAFINDANRGTAALPAGTELKITGILMALPDSQRTALYDNMLAAGVVTSEEEYAEKVLPFMLMEVAVDYSLTITIVGASALLVSIFFFIMAGVMFKKRRKVLEEAELAEIKKIDFTKIKQPESDKFFTKDEDADKLVMETPRDSKNDKNDDGSYKPKMPVPTAQAAPDDLDLSNLDFSSLKPPEDDDPLF